VDAATLIVLCAAWLVLALAVLADLTGHRPPRHESLGLAYRWMGAGLLLMCTGAAVRQFGEVRKWPVSRLLVLDTLNLVLTVAGVACVITGIVAAVRSRRAARGA
jgi:hypothetical protein